MYVGKKKSCHLVPKVVIDLPFEGMEVEGSREKRVCLCVTEIEILVLFISSL